MKTRTLVIIISALMIYLLIGVLTGCRTKTVTEYVSVHDTLRTHSVDTVTKTTTIFRASSDSTDRYQFRDRTEKVLKIRDRTVTLNDRGDTTRVDTRTATLHFLHESDSSGIYKARVDSLTLLVDTYKSRCDSLQSVIDRQHEKVIVRKVSWWSVWKWKIAAFSLLCALVFVLLRKYWSAIKNTFRTKIFK